jgi:hypothetical protein
MEVGIDLERRRLAGNREAATSEQRSAGTVNYFFSTFTFFASVLNLSPFFWTTVIVMAPVLLV